jgi:hypothetical protein
MRDLLQIKEYLLLNNLAFLEKVEEIGGITVYKILNKNEEEKQWN